MEPVRQPTLYELLESLPEGLTGEILNGQLHTQPRPSKPHAIAASVLGYELIGPFHKGRSGPGGWWIIDEPEVHFVRDREVAVPDLGGWRRERMPHPSGDQRFEVVPDWVCEILSPSTASKDREMKMPLYARYGVAYAWLVDPTARTLEAFALEGRLAGVCMAESGSTQAPARPVSARGRTLTEVNRIGMERSIVPETIESVRCQLGIANGVLDVAMTQVMLNRTGIQAGCRPWRVNTKGGSPR